MRGDSPMARLSPAGLLAAELGVTRGTVNRWLRGGIQGCDVNVDRLIEAGLRYSPRETEAVLRGDLESHRAAVEGAFFGVGGGSVRETGMIRWDMGVTQRGV